MEDESHIQIKTKSKGGEVRFVVYVFLLLSTFNTNFCSICIDAPFFSCLVLFRFYLRLRCQGDTKLRLTSTTTTLEIRPPDP